MSKGLSRREVLRTAAVAAVGVPLVGSAMAEQQRKWLHSEPIRFGIIGVGGKGWSGMEQAAQFGDIVALCDVDVAPRAKGMAEHPKAAAFTDFRHMIDAMRGRVDAVVISTPDHVHAPAAAYAMRAGLHVYCEKPLSRTIWEARRLQELARQFKVQTQMGNQFTSHNPLRKTAAAIQKGLLGKVIEIHLWTDRPGGWWKQGVPRPEAKIAPKTVDFDLWLGPSPDRPFAEGYHPFSWRGWWDFGTGSLGDIGCHNFNLAFQALDLRDPLAVQAQTSGHNRDSFPAWSIVTYEFGARGDRAPMKLYWYDGGKKPPAELGPGVEFGGNGSLIVCEKGTLYAPNEYGGDPRLLSGDPIPETDFVESPGHMAEFARAIKEGKPANSNFPDYSGPLTETVLLGNLAVWADGPRLEWDSKRMQVKGGGKEYDSLIRPTYRPGWAL
ncbi:MAG: Gfo/Idh/MocA family oxidoreductase [Methanoregulaceae archaeon]|nr:Gfo/Idh/MocA family oxidoreductase [Methanoregulaceae archaeon]